MSTQAATGDGGHDRPGVYVLSRDDVALARRTGATGRGTPKGPSLLSSGTRAEAYWCPMPDALDGLRTAHSRSYAIERELGRGGMATVYLAEDLKHGRKVAVKVM